MKVLFIGLGSISTRHIKNLISVCRERAIDLEITVLRRKAGELTEDLQCLNIRQIEVLSEEKYDVAFITNPTNLHYEVLLKIKELVKFYFIEKPIFDSCKYDFHFLDITEKNAYIACPMRHTKAYKEFTKVLKNKYVFSSRIICSSYLPNWRPKQDYRKNYSAIKALGGGVTLDLIHEIDYMVDLFGFPNNVVNIHGKYSDLEIDSDDLSVYLAEYKDKLVEVHLDYYGRKSRRYCEVYTQEGTYKVDFIESKLYLPDNSVIDCKEDVNTRYVNEINYFLDFIEGKIDNINPPEKAYNVLKVTLGEYGK